MTLVKLPSCEIVLVEPPENSSKTEIYVSSNSLYILSGFNPWEMEHKEITLPPGSYELLGRCSEISEEVAAGIVESGRRKYMDYVKLEGRTMQIALSGWRYRLSTAIESLESLILSHGHTKDCLIIKKVK